MSSASPTDLTPASVAQPFLDWFGTRATGLERIGGGRNSQVYRVDTEAGRKFALKVYFRHAADSRDRLATEYGSFAYLWGNGFREIPEPLASDPARGWAVYQYLEAERLAPGQAGAAEVLAAADFLIRLRALSHKPDSRRLGIASEAHFTLAQVGAHVDARFQKLRLVPHQGPAYRQLQEFLEQEFAPLFGRVMAASRDHLQASGASPDEELPWELRTLSPSDFGFHNALRHPGGGVFFLDFEYFGWDDPAKMVSDFLLHPAMESVGNAEEGFRLKVVRRILQFPRLACPGGKPLPRLRPEVVPDSAQ